MDAPERRDRNYRSSDLSEVSQPMRQAASVMNLNQRVPHMYIEFIMHTMVNYTHIIFRPHTM